MRFLLLDKYDSSKVQAYRFNRGCFGVSCLPFILCATIIHHMNELKIREKDLSLLIEQFLRDLYMDDETTAVNLVEEGMRFHDFAKKSMEEAGLELRTWDSNSQKLREYMNCEDGNEDKKLLGISWNRNVGDENDEFVFNLSELATEASQLETTKRNILTVGAKFFDPAGWISPIVVVAKMYYQRACKERYSWDESVKEELQKGWLKYLQHLTEIKSIRISRYLFSSIIDIAENIQLHGYCDSSEQAYCAVIYAHASSSDGSSSASRIVTSKSKVTPIKKTSIPRLELLSCTLLSELMRNVCRVLQDVTVIDKTCFWSDSEVALAWIKGKENKAKWTPWVDRRVKKVK